MQLDVGYGDKIIHGPVEIDFPVLLDGSIPNILVYSKESAIAEKFEAIVKLKFGSSRLKDFYDLLFLADNHSFNQNNLKEAIISTFERRETSIEDRHIIFSEEFKTDSNKQIQWTAFLKKSRLEFIESFPEVIDRIQDFIDSIFESK